jgi:hypothetical protein
MVDHRWVRRHATFPDLVLHDDDELLRGARHGRRRARGGENVWPLSCVERVALADGTRLAYKSQLPPTVEPGVYAAASSPLLPAYRSWGCWALAAR